MASFPLEAKQPIGCGRVRHGEAFWSPLCEKHVQVAPPCTVYRIGWAATGSRKPRPIITSTQRKLEWRAPTIGAPISYISKADSRVTLATSRKKHHENYSKLPSAILCIMHSLVGHRWATMPGSALLARTTTKTIYCAVCLHFPVVIPSAELGCSHSNHP